MAFLHEYFSAFFFAASCSPRLTLTVFSAQTCLVTQSGRERRCRGDAEGLDFLGKPVNSDLLTEKGCFFSWCMIHATKPFISKKTTICGV
jgi:hypothetical protein